MSAASTARADKLFEKAVLAIKDKDFSKACSILVETIKLKPDLAEAWVVRGNVRMAQDQSFDAILHYDRALDINEQLWDCWNNRGIALSNLAMWQMAEVSFRKSLELMPAIEPHINMGSTYCMMMRLEDAEREYRACLEYEPLNFDAHLNLGVTLLGLGRWVEAWPHYEARHHNVPYAPKQRRVLPNWTGEDLTGKTIVLYPEQGQGDEIMFMRFASLPKSRGASRVILEASPSLLRMAKTLQGIDEVCVKGDAPYKEADFASAVMDIPMRFGIESSNVPAPQRYLHAGSDAPDLPSGLNVGLCWHAGHRPLQLDTRATEANKSLLLEWLRPVTAISGVNLISLQKEQTDLPLMKELGIINHMDAVSDFADTAALIEKLDLVISVDTAVAHLAGALGKPVWNFVRYSGYWPWMREVKDTVWYPSMRIYRQPELFNWDPPLQAMFADLERLALRQHREAAE